MKINTLSQPSTAFYFKSAFIIPKSLINTLESLELAGPQGRWAEWPEGRQHNLQIRVYYPANFVAGAKGVVSLQTHTNPQGRTQKRINFRSFLPGDAGLQEMDHKSIGFQITNFFKDVEPAQTCDGFEEKTFEAFGIAEGSTALDEEFIKYVENQFDEGKR